jgi:malonate decarboxylase epsilon subunit
MSVLFSFPGQGAQQSGMLHALPPHAEVERTLNETTEALKLDPLSLDSERSLQSTLAVQLCLTIAGVATARLLIAEGARPEMVAGFSIGEYPAAVVAGALGYADALHLVARRAHLMEDAFPDGYGMAAIVGLDRTQLEPLIAQVHGNATPVYLANLNAERQLAISGAEPALRAVMALAREYVASKAERLAVKVPSHCPLFLPAAQELAKVFEGFRVLKPSLTYLSSGAARALFQPNQIADTLAANMARQVHWSETMRLAWERGARIAVEMPSGSVLSKLTEPVFINGRAISCQGMRIDSLLALISR